MHFLIIPSNYLPTIIIEHPPPRGRGNQKRKSDHILKINLHCNSLWISWYSLFPRAVLSFSFSSLSFFICPWLRRLNYSQLRYLTAMLRMSVITPIIITCSVSWCRIVYFICDTVNFFELPITRPHSAFALIDPITIFLVIWFLVAYY